MSTSRVKTVSIEAYERLKQLYMDEIDRAGRAHVELSELKRRIAADPEKSFWGVNNHAGAVDPVKTAVIDALSNTVRILEAVRYTAGLGKNQVERLEKAKSVLKEAKA